MKLSDGRITTTDESILSLFTFNPLTRRWSCLGTGFFVQPNGVFVTAKHVVLDSGGNRVQTLYGVQTTPLGDRDLRVAVSFEVHPDADIAIGLLGPHRKGRVDLPPKDSIPFQLDFGNLEIGDGVRSYAFPQTKDTIVSVDATEFTIQGKWMKGEIIDYREKGSSKVSNRTYFSSMNVEGGASGGPVIKNNLVVGINSSSYASNTSCVTPIDYILDMSVKEFNGEVISIRQLVEQGNIPAVNLPEF